MGAPPFGVPLVQLDRRDPQITRDLCVMCLSPVGRDGLEALHGLDVDPTDVSGPCVTDAPALTLQQPLDSLLGELGGFHQRPPTRGEFLPTRLAAQPLDVLVLTGPRAVRDGACPPWAPTGAAHIGTREVAIGLTLWREGWITHGHRPPYGHRNRCCQLPVRFQLSRCYFPPGLPKFATEPYFNHTATYFHQFSRCIFINLADVFSSI